MRMYALEGGRSETSMEEKRAQKNRDLILKCVVEKQSAALMPSAATFFPPRPVIKKDQREIARTLGEE